MLGVLPMIQGRLIIASVAIAVLAAAPVATGAEASKSGKQGPHSTTPHLCAWGNASGALASAEVSGGCSEKHGRTKMQHTPYGNLGVAIYSAKFGTSTPGLVPQHTLLVTAFKEIGTGKAAKYIEKQARLKVIEEGAPVAYGGKVTASWNGDTYSCENPPTGDCTQSNFQAVKGPWILGAGLLGAPPGTAGAEEEGASEDEPQDLQQEEALKGPVVSIGLYIAGKL